MQILVFGDTHLGKKIDKKKFDFIKEIIQQHDKVIINGDFWDAKKCAFEEFVRSGWSELFPLLKERDAVYLYGNHDPKVLCDEKVSFFSKTAKLQHEFTYGRHKYFITHGDLYDKNCRRMQWLFNFNPKLDSIIEFPISLLGAFHMKMLKYGYDFGHWGRFFNKIVKAEAQNKDEIFIVGHTHHPEEFLEKNYINQGFIEYGIATYVTINEAGCKLIEKAY